MTSLRFAGTREITFLFSLSGNVFAAAAAVHCLQYPSPLLYCSSFSAIFCCVFHSPFSLPMTGDNNDLFPFILFILCHHASKIHQLMCVLTITLCRVGVFFFVCLFVVAADCFFCCESGISFVLVRCVSLGRTKNTAEERRVERGKWGHYSHYYLYFFSSVQLSETLFFRLFVLFPLKFSFANGTNASCVCFGYLFSYFLCFCLVYSLRTTSEVIYASDFQCFPSRSVSPRSCRPARADGLDKKPFFFFLLSILTSFENLTCGMVGWMRLFCWCC